MSLEKSDPSSSGISVEALFVSTGVVTLAEIGDKTQLLALLLALLVWLLVRHYLRARLGGTTGDTAGALVELVEVVVLIGCAIA